MEDGASCHKGFSFEYHEVNEFDCIQWPAQSPDLNLIEAFWLNMGIELEEAWGRASNIEKLEEFFGTLFAKTVWRV
jgi:hypothetical protein